LTDTGKIVALGLTVVALHGAMADDTAPLEPLIDILRNADDYKQRLAAVIGLGRGGDLRAVPALIDALEDPDHTVRGTAARVLGTLGDDRALPALEALLLRAGSDFVRGQAQEALVALMTKEEGKEWSGSGTDIHGALGTLGQAAIQNGINAHLPKAIDCFSQRFQAAPYLGGRVELEFRVATDGQVKWVRIQHSDLGSLEVEQCVVKQMRSARFEAPDGGEVEFSMPLDFGGGRATMALDTESTAARQLQDSCEKLLRGKDGAPLKIPKGLRIGLYVAPGGGVVSVGLSAGGAEIAPELAEALVANVKELTLMEPSLGGKHGKLMFQPGCGP